MRASSAGVVSGRRGNSGSPALQAALLDRVGNRGMVQLVQRKESVVDRQVGAEPASGGCNTCEIPGGIGVCCLAPDAPFVDECFEIGKRIIDTCPTRPADCLPRAKCEQCKCIGRVRGERYCVCTGIV